MFAGDCYGLVFCYGYFATEEKEKKRVKREKQKQKIVKSKKNEKLITVLLSCQKRADFGQFE